MRKIWLGKDDFELFFHEIGPLDYEFFRSHMDAFKRMWREQRARFWKVFIATFEEFMWTHALKDFPPLISGENVKQLSVKIFDNIRELFVIGKVSSAKNLINHCALVAQNKQTLGMLDRVNTSQNPFYVKETREAFRSLFGEPSAKDTYIKLMLGLPLYLKFAGAVVVALKRWLQAEDIEDDDKAEMDKFFDSIHAAPASQESRQPQDQDKASAKGKSTKSKEVPLSKDTAVLMVEEKILPTLNRSPSPVNATTTTDARATKSTTAAVATGGVDGVMFSGCSRVPVGTEPSQIASVGTEPSQSVKHNSSPESGSREEQSHETSQDLTKRKMMRLHTCATCQKKEETSKTFKRCQRCRGRPNPSYYCSKECQTADWKAGHKERHMQEMM